MWTYAKPTLKSWYRDSVLRYEHALRMQNSSGYVNECAVTPQGWILTEVFTGNSAGTSEYYLYLIDSGSLIAIYSITFDEYNDFPEMGPAWWIPF